MRSHPHVDLSGSGVQQAGVPRLSRVDELEARLQAHHAHVHSIRAAPSYASAAPPRPPLSPLASLRTYSPSSPGRLSAADLAASPPHAHSHRQHDDLRAAELAMLRSQNAALLAELEAVRRERDAALEGRQRIEIDASAARVDAIANTNRLLAKLEAAHGAVAALEATNASLEALLQKQQDLVGRHGADYAAHIDRLQRELAAARAATARQPQPESEPEPESEPAAPAIADDAPARRLTAAQEARIDGVMALIDENANGHIDRDEVVSVLVYLGADHEAANDQAREWIATTADDAARDVLPEHEMRSLLVTLLCSNQPSVLDNLERALTRVNALSRSAAAPASDSGSDSASDSSSAGRLFAQIFADIDARSSAVAHADSLSTDSGSHVSGLSHLLGAPTASDSASDSGADSASDAGSASGTGSSARADSSTDDLRVLFAAAEDAHGASLSPAFLAALAGALGDPIAELDDVVAEAAPTTAAAALFEYVSDILADFADRAAAESFAADIAAAIAPLCAAH